MAEKVTEPLHKTVDRAYVDGLLEKCTIPTLVQADIFAEKICEIVGDIARARHEQNLKSYTAEELRFVIHSALVAAIYHSGQKRDSGTGYFEEHLHGAARIEVNTLGRTKHTLVGAVYMHDLVEDTAITSTAEFEKAWCATFAHDDDPFIKKSLSDRKRSWAIVTGLTQVPPPPYVKGLEAKLMIQGGTLRLLLEKILKLGFDVLYAKGGDRLHNMNTIWSKKEDDPDKAEDARNWQSDIKKKRKANETAAIYIPFFAILGAQQYVREAVDRCAGVLNRPLLEAFNAERDERYHTFIRRKIEPTYPEVSDKFDLRGGVEVQNFIGGMFRGASIADEILSCDLVPAQLGDFVTQDSKPLEHKTMADLPITRRTPLFEIVIIVKPETDKAAVADLLKKKWLKPGETYEESQSDPDALVQRGRTLTIFSKSYGRKNDREGYGIINFRVNDSVSEARIKRGEIPFDDNRGIGTNESVPTYVRLAIRRIIEETSDDVTRVLPLMRELLLKPRVKVFTPDNDPIVLPRGATPLDVADEVHAKLLVAMKGVLHHISQGVAVPVSPFDEVQDGMVLEISKVIPGGMGEFELDRAALHFCATENARRTIIKYVLGKKPVGGVSSPLTPDEKIIKGRSYLENIANIFGIGKNRALKPIMSEILRLRKIKQRKLYKERKMRASQERERAEKEKAMRSEQEVVAILASLPAATISEGIGRFEDSDPTLVPETAHVSESAPQRRERPEGLLPFITYVVKGARRKVHLKVPWLERVVGSPNPVREVRKLCRAAKIQRIGLEKEAPARVWMGEIDELRVLAQEKSMNKRTWHIRIELADQEGVLEKYTGEFKQAGLNVNRIIQIPGPPRGKHIMHLALEDRNKAKSPYDMMKLLLKLSYKYDYDIQVQSDNVALRTLRMAADYVISDIRKLRHLWTGKPMH